ncbi:MAG: glycerol-3-phosphate 1-O-acyltransferase PlsY [Oscillospiraceae bacterium]|nr:glycerol-3-phosphate 1-O-acyltransferase PlsY [Oscillospiraceae bacterium]
MAGLIVCLAGYLLGCIIFGILISKGLYHDDVRTHGSGSAGMTNMLRTYGKLAAVLTAVGDIGKGVLAAVLGEWVFAALVPGLEPVCGAYLGGFMAVVGHLFPVFFRFKGGKGVLTAAGAIIATEPVVVVALALIFLAVFLASRMVSLGSITVAALYPVFTLLWGLWRQYNGQTLAVSTAAAALMAALVIWMHRTNIQRLKNGTEYRFGQKKK